MSARLAALLFLAATGDGAPGEGPALADVVAAAEREEWDAALASVEQLLEDAAALPEWMQARARFARGVILVRCEEQQPSEPGYVAAAPDFESARALAGPGRLRLDATYDLGLVRLLQAERLRALLPEVAGAAASMAPPKQGDQEDPLPAARAAYVEAREAFVERLRADWRDEDTRANLELIQRRLAELDEIERQRQEQQQQQDDEQGDGEQQEGEGEEGEPQDGDESEGDPDREPSEGQQPTDASQDAGEQESGDQASGEQPAEPQPAERPQEGEGEARPGEVSAERHLTREEVLRLLDRLGELEAEGEALEALLREARRVPVDRDW